jgi:hypothetical protein
MDLERLKTPSALHSRHHWPWPAAPKVAYLAGQPKVVFMAYPGHLSSGRRGQRAYRVPAALESDAF